MGPTNQSLTCPSWLAPSEVITVQRLAKEAVKRAQLARGDTCLGRERQGVHHGFTMGSP
jgi:hypothetical protein